MKVHRSSRAGTRAALAVLVAVTLLGTTVSETASAATKRTTKRTARKTTKKRKPTTTVPPAATPIESTTTTPPTTTLAPPTTVALAADATAPPIPPPLTALAPIGIERAVFEPCAEVECAKVKVPRNYADPKGEQITLFVSRRKARVAETRIGTLFLNPGGPGGATLDLVRSASELVSPAVLDRFDIIGVDPRGTERSTALRCNARRTPFDRTLIDATPPEAQPARITYSTLAQRCRDSEGTRLDYMDTETAARDLDAIRESLGEETISYLGISYGTYLGAMYANLFPARTRSAVLDERDPPQPFRSANRGGPIRSGRADPRRISRSVCAGTIGSVQLQ